MSEWRSVPLRELADIRVSNVDKKTTAGESSVRLCNYMDVYSNDYIRADLPFMEASASSAEIAKFKVQRGDVLITKDSETPDDIGVPAVVVEEVGDLVCGYHLALIKPKRDLVDPVFLMKQLSTAVTASYFARHAAGSTRYGLSNGAIANTRIPLAPLRQQQRIAAILTSLDTAIEKTEALIEKHQQIKAGLMHDLFTRGVLPNGQLRPPREQAPELYRETRSGWIPREWTLCQLGDIASVSRGKFTHRPRNDPAFLGGPFPFIQTGDVAAVAGEAIHQYSQTLSAKGASVSACFPAQTIAVTIAANIADTAILAVPMYFPDSVVGVVVGPTVDTRFVELSIRRAKPRLNALAPQSAQKNINLKDLRPLEMPVAPLAEQREIAARYEAAQSPIDMNAKLLLKLRAQKLGLMQDLLTGKVPVKVERRIAEPTDA